VIRTGADAPTDLTLRTQVCVIGSGAGGAVAAAVFAEAGRDVLVLEEGQHVPGSAMTQREEEMYPLLYRDGGQQYTADGAVSVLQGRVLGGSTVINQADVEPIPDVVLDHWRARYGVDRYSSGRLEEAAAACMTEIGANPIAEASLNRNNRLLLESGRALGIHGAPFVHNRVGCRGSGYCMVGCAYDAKRSAALTWVPRAAATGRAVFQTDARVDRLDHDGHRIRAAVGTLTARLPDGDRSRPFRVEADHFVLAAGTVHSPAILLRSGIGGGQVGRNLTLQPQAPVAALMPDEVVHWRGVPQAAYLDGHEDHSVDHGLGGFRLEAISGTPGMSAASMPQWGPDMRAFMRRYRHVAALLALVPDQPGGRVKLSRSGRPAIHYRLQRGWTATMRRALRVAGQVYLSAGAEAVVLPFAGAAPAHSPSDLDVIDRARFAPNRLSLISAHPQGTCRMGATPADSVVGLDLRLHGTDNLQVVDASVFPSSASTHTMVPVMQLAWLAAHDVIG